MIKTSGECYFIFHNRKYAWYQGMSTINADTPPSARSLQQMISQYRNRSFTTSISEEDGEWKNMEPTALMDVIARMFLAIVYAFVEHGLIPPMGQDCRKSLANSFSILMSTTSIFIRV